MKRLVLGIISVLFATGCGPYTAAYRATYATMGAVQLTGDTLGQVERPKHEECLKKGINTQAYADCIKATLKRLKAWQQYARPSARSSVAATLGGTRIAERGKQSNWDWMTVLKAAGCAVIMSVQEWEKEFPDKAKGILGALQWIKPIMCAKKKAVGGVVSIVLQIGIGVVEIAKSIFGSANEELAKGIEKWLNDPAKDATDQLVKDIASSMPK
jgi:hypothetical protein